MARPKPEVRASPKPATLARDEFGRRFRERFADPAFVAVRDELARIEAIAWEAYDDGRKAPRTRKAGRVSRIRTTTCRSTGSLPAMPIARRRRAR